jgi:hypothetical protein
MSDNTPDPAFTPYVAPPSIQSQIDAMVAAASASGAAPTIARQPKRVSLSSPDAEPVVAGDASVVYLEGANDADDGRDLVASYEKLVADYNYILAKRDAVQYDPRTGTPTYVHGERERAALHTLALGMYETVQYQHAAYTRMQERRDARKAEADRTREIDAAKQLFAKGDPQRAAMLNEEIQREHARRLAITILDARK